MVEKRKRGRPYLEPDGRHSFTTRLRLEDVEFLREVGRGGANYGIELLIDAFRATLKRNERAIVEMWSSADRGSSAIRARRRAP